MAKKYREIHLGPQEALAVHGLAILFRGGLVPTVVLRSMHLFPPSMVAREGSHWRLQRVDFKVADGNGDVVTVELACREGSSAWRLEHAWAFRDGDQLWRCRFGEAENPRLAATVITRVL